MSCVPTPYNYPVSSSTVTWTICSVRIVHGSSVEVGNSKAEMLSGKVPGSNYCSSPGVAHELVD